MNLIKQRLVFSANTIWLLIGCLIAILSLALPIFATQYFWFGYFYQSAPIIIVFWWLGAICIFWLVWTYRTRPKLVEYAFSFPIVWGFLIFAIVSGLLSFTHTSILQTWVGAPEIAEGGIGFLVQAVLAALFIILTRIPKIKYFLIITGIILGTIFAIITFLGTVESPFKSLLHWKWAPYYFPDYLAYIALAFIGYYVVSYNAISCKSYKQMCLGIGIVLSIGFVTYLAENKSFTYGLYLSCCMIVACKVVFRSKRTIHKFLPYMCLLLMLVAISVLVKYPDIKELMGWEHANPTLLIRGILIRLTIADLFDYYNLHAIKELLFGRGWGTYAEFVTQNLFTIQELSVYSGEKLAKSNEAITRDFFHSHNLFIEWFSSLGICGVLTLLGVFYYIIRSFKIRYIYLSSIFIFAFIILNSFWFQINATLAYPLLAFVLLSRPMPCKMPKFLKIVSNKDNLKTTSPWIATANSGYKRKGVVFLGASYATCLFLFTCFYCKFFVEIGELNKIKVDNNYLYDIKRMLKNPFFRFDQYCGSKHGVLILRNKSLQAIATVESGLTANGAESLNILVGNTLSAEYLHKASSSCRRIQNCSIALNILGELASSPDLGSSFAANTHLLKLWLSIAQDYLQVSVLRTDMLIPLLNYVVLRDKHALAWDIIEQILQVNANDPVALWYSGTIKLDNIKTIQSALYDLNKSLELGINRFIPLSAEQIEFIKHNK